MSFLGIVFSFDFKLKQIDICIGDGSHCVMIALIILRDLIYAYFRKFFYGRSCRNTILELQECCKHAQNKSKHCASVTGILALTKKKPAEKMRTRAS